MPRVSGACGVRRVGAHTLPVLPCPLAEELVFFAGRSLAFIGDLLGCLVGPVDHHAILPVELRRPRSVVSFSVSFSYVRPGSPAHSQPCHRRSQTATTHSEREPTDLESVWWQPSGFKSPSSVTDDHANVKSQPCTGLALPSQSQCPSRNRRQGSLSTPLAGSSASAPRAARPPDQRRLVDAAEHVHSPNALICHHRK